MFGSGGCETGFGRDAVASEREAAHIDCAEEKMNKYKGATHAIAVALGTLVLAGLSPQGQVLISKLPCGEAIYAGVAFVGVLLGVYHVPVKSI